MSVAATCSRPPSARSRTPDRICTLARVDTARATMPSFWTSPSRWQTTFIPVPTMVLISII